MTNSTNSTCFLSIIIFTIQHVLFVDSNFVFLRFYFVMIASGPGKKVLYFRKYPTWVKTDHICAVTNMTTPKLAPMGGWSANKELIWGVKIMTDIRPTIYENISAEVWPGLFLKEWLTFPWGPKFSHSFKLFKLCHIV